MQKAFYNLVFIAVLSLIFVNCANRGTPGGGDKDITPPKITKSIPENYSSNFSGKEIKIYFDEYIKIKNLQRQLIISPPMDTQPEVTPLGSASKYITIKIFDTLTPNTTYAFNFGNSIVDNNEENPFPYYKYVFSTGDYIDSLTVKGNILDAKNIEPDDFVSVMLYEVDSTFNDSIIYKKTPRYITNTLDSVTTFSVENVKAGKYMMIALKDENNDFKFQQKTDKIGFIKDYITVPNDSSYTIKLFKEDLDFKATRPRLISGEKIAFGYEGDYKDMKISMLSNKPEDFKSRVTKDAETDSLNYWYSPRLEVDSLLFKVKHPTIEKDFTVRISEQKRDSLTLKSEPTNDISLLDNFKIIASIPFDNIDESKISILDKDSTNVAFTTVLDTLSNSYNFRFEKTEANTYAVQVLPEAFTDFFENKNKDTLSYRIRTKALSDFGNVRVTLQNAIYPVIVQLTDGEGKVKAESFSAKQEPVDFLNVNPGNYFLRVIYDTNSNQKYDSGNYLEKRQPERISYYPEQLDVRSNWDEIEEFTLLD